jgi:hypothetical protein
MKDLKNEKPFVWGPGFGAGAVQSFDLKGQMNPGKGGDKPSGYSAPGAKVSGKK